MWAVYRRDVQKIKDMKKLIYTVIVFFISKAAYLQNDIFDIAKKGTVAMFIRTIKGNADLVNQTNKEGITPLMLACHKGNNEVASYLISIVDNINTSSEMGTALIACATKGNNIIAKLLLEKKADPNIKDACGNTALMYAVQFKNIELVKLLLDYNADKKQRDGLGKTAFEYAAFLNNSALVNLLK